MQKREIQLILIHSWHSKLQKKFKGIIIYLNFCCKKCEERMFGNLIECKKKLLMQGIILFSMQRHGMEKFPTKRKRGTNVVYKSQTYEE